MYPSKRQCNDVELTKLSATATHRPTITKRSKSAEILTFNGEDKLTMFTFSEQDYGEKPRLTNTKGPNTTTTPNSLRKFQVAKRRNRSRENSLCIDNDNTLVKEYCYDSQGRCLTSQRPSRQPPSSANRSPVWKSTPSLPSMYADTCTYRDPNKITPRENASSNGRLDRINHVDAYTGHGRGYVLANGKQQQRRFETKPMVRERSMDFLVGQSNHIVDPLARGNIKSPGINNTHSSTRLAQEQQLLSFTHGNRSNANMSRIPGQGFGGDNRPHYLEFHPINPNIRGRSVEALDTDNDLDVDSPDSAHQLLQASNKTKNTNTKDKRCRCCAQTCCARYWSCTKYQTGFYIVLILNLILVGLNILGLPVIIKSMSPDVPQSERLAGIGCMKCDELNPLCDVESLGLVRRGGDQCCVDDSQPKLSSMLKAVDVYINCSMNGYNIPPGNPVMQYSFHRGQNIGSDNRIIWNKHGDVPPKGFGSMGFENSELQIVKAGHYFIYTKVDFKKKSNSTDCGYSIMKTDHISTRTTIDSIDQHCFKEDTRQFSIHSSHLITVHKFNRNEGVYVELKNKDNFDIFTDVSDTKIIMFYMDLTKNVPETRYAKQNSKGDSEPIS